jgi:hypothetical protein
MIVNGTPRGVRKLAAGLVLLSASVAAAEPQAVMFGDADEPTDARATPVVHYYLDPLRGPTAFEPEYQLWFGDDRRPIHLVRAGLEMAGLLAIGTTYYWLLPQLNSTDWIIPDLGSKFTDPSVTFDNNMHRTNHLLHPFAGAMSYWFSRINGLSVYESSAASFLSSMFFETVLEYRETTSINDLVVTPGEGIPVGEFFFHFGDYLNSAAGHDNAAQRAFALTFGLPQYLHDRLDGVDRAPPSTPDALGYASAYWHRFALGYGSATVASERSRSGEVHDLILDMELVAIPGFLRPGQLDVPFHQGNFTELRLRTSLAEGMLADVDLAVNADLAGWYHQSYGSSGDDLRGNAWMLAASTETRYVDRWVLGRRDLFAIAHLLGPDARLWLALGNGLAARAQADVHLDFAGMGSPAYQMWIAQYGPAGTKSVLQRHGYYFGIGGSARLSASVGFYGLELGGHAAYGAYRSIDGFDQEQQDTYRDVANTDQVLEFGASIDFSPPPVPLGVRVGWDELRHRSQMAPFSADWRDQRVAASASLRF